MSVTREIGTSRQRVWEVLSDGWLFANWVVGASRIRAVDAHWPAVGARISHSVGPWPLVVNDDTVVDECVPLKELVLRAKTWPFGEAIITMRMADESGGCRVEMEEVAVSGPPKLVPTHIQKIVFAPRNRECLWRLANIAEHKQPHEIE